MDFVFFVRGEKGSMECVMDLSHFGEVQLIGDWEKNFDNCEGSFTFGDEFWVCNRLFEVSGH